MFLKKLWCCVGGGGGWGGWVYQDNLVLSAELIV